MAHLKSASLTSTTAAALPQTQLSKSSSWRCGCHQSQLSFTNAGFLSPNSIFLRFTNRAQFTINKRRAGSKRIQAAVFDQLSSGLEKAWLKLQGLDVLTSENIKEPLQDIRRALLEADVSLPVVRNLVKSISEKAVGIEVIRGVSPAQQLVKVVNDELVKLMGGQAASIQFAKTPPTVILMAGLQGVGKTTACGKLALYMKKKEKSCMLLATDVYRPAAIEQLMTLGKQVDVPVFEAGNELSPVEIARRGLEEASSKGVDVVIVDTAGRLQIDAAMMNELKEIKNVTSPTEVLLVVDAMTGQEAAALVSTFNLEIGITGAILTKIDGDSRGGAALSVQEVSGKPIKFVGEGESMTALEPFYPDRMASRILGMGDVLSFVEKAKESMVQEDAEEIQRKILEAKFDFNDYLKQLRMISRMGSMGGVLKLIPGMNKITPQQLREGERSLRIAESIINVMTPEERQDPELLARSPSRRKRIATDSSTSEAIIDQLVAQLFEMRAKMKNVATKLQSGSMPSFDDLKTTAAEQQKIPAGTAKRKKQKQALGNKSSVPKGFGASKK